MEFIVNSPYRMLFFYFCCVWHNSTTMGRRRIEEMPETVTDNRSKSFLIYNFRFGDLRAAQLPEYGRSSLRGTWRSTSYLVALFYSHSSFNSFVSRYSEGKFKVFCFFFWCDEIGSWKHDAWLKCLTTFAHVRCRRSFSGSVSLFRPFPIHHQAIYRWVVRPFVNGEEFQLAGSRLDWENVCAAKESGRKEVSNTI